MIMNRFHEGLNSIEFTLRYSLSSRLKALLEPSSTKLVLQESSCVVRTILMVCESIVFDENINNIGRASDKYNSEPEKWGVVCDSDNFLNF